MSRALWLLFLFAHLVPLVVSFSTSGNKILDANGNQIVIRGVARPSLEWNPQGQFLSYNDYAKMKEWGANSVRLSLNQCYWLPGSNGYSSGYQAVVDQQVTWIKQLGMSVILDLHWTNQAVQAWGCDKQQPMADAWSKTFWTQVATKYKNDPVIIFELFNEPYITDWNIWRNGGNTYGFNVVGFQELYDTVRATGANNVVIINGLNYAFDLSGAGSRLITGKNIVYGTHPYNFQEKMQGYWDGAFGYLAATQPLIATEFGTFDCSDSYIKDWVKYANDRCISWTAWAWWPGGCGFPSVIADWNYNPVAYGQTLKESMLSNFKCGGQSSTTKSATTSTTSTTKSATTTTTTTTTGTTKSATTTTTTTGTTKAATTTTTTGSSTTGGGSSVTVYADNDIASPFQDWSWAATRNKADSSKTYGGSATSYSFVPSGYNAVYVYRADYFSKASIKSIDFYFNKGTNSNLNLHFNVVELVNNNSNKIGNSNQVESYCGPRDSNGWAKCTVPISTLLGSNSGYYDGFWFQDQSGGTQSTVYVDSITVVTL